MKKSEVKRLLKAGECQIYNDAPDRLELLRELTARYWQGINKYYIIKDSDCLPFKNRKIINLSDITEDEVVWKREEMEWSKDCEIWNEATNGFYRLKQIPNNDKEIAELLERLKQLGYNKCT